jgi:hypothetical protein
VVGARQHIGTVRDNLGMRVTWITSEEGMTTRLDKALKREIEVEGKLYTATISPEGIKVVEKGKRNGHEVSWSAVISGDAALRQDLRISLDAMKS